MESFITTQRETDHRLRCVLHRYAADASSPFILMEIAMTDTNNNWIQTIIESIRPAGITDEDWNTRSLFGWHGGNMRKHRFCFEDTPDFYSMHIDGRCVITGEDYRIRNVPNAEFQEWLDGAMIQDALSMLSEEDRGFLLDGMTDEGREQLVARKS